MTASTNTSEELVMWRRNYNQCAKFSKAVPLQP